MKDLIKKFIPSFLLDWYHLILAFLGVLFYGFPSRKMKVIGVTGTNGKSTVVNLIARTLEEAGFKVAYLSSIEFKIREKTWPNVLKMTMPGRFKIQKFLRQAVNNKCQYAVLEVTPEGIKQHRHQFIDFNTAVFTNLSPEHIEAHGSFENYKKAKGKLFQTTRNIHVINIDDKNTQYFLQFPANRKYTYGLVQGDINNKNLQLNLRLIGSFNIYNALAAICVGLSQGINLEICKRAVEKAEGIPGRMEMLIKEPFKVIVDYAVTPDALEKLYQIIRKTFNPQRIIAVFGACGGGRDKWKRPVLGEIAAKYCDMIFLTNEDPYDEDEFQIISQIEAGITIDKKLATEIILDRRRAIREAIKSAKTNDVVVITGKGCEPWICVANGKKIPWDDRRVVREELEKFQK